ncbi:MAG: hypothetical protein JNM76_12555 [Betaproteobacteria bacterium]|nr:hypothetical protein [Betaproteobacteria bacterium]
MHIPAAEPVLAPRQERAFTQTIHATPDRVFPLLCPVMEARWLNDWTYRMIHSESGVAEPGAVFETPHADGRTLWIITAHEPDTRVAFARWQPDDLVVSLDIRLAPHGTAKTRVDIRYVWTGIGPLARSALDALTVEAWRDNMLHWERSMNAWLANAASRTTATC